MSDRFRVDVSRDGRHITTLRNLHTGEAPRSAFERAWAGPVGTITVIRRAHWAGRRPAITGAFGRVAERVVAYVGADGLRHLLVQSSEQRPLERVFVPFPPPASSLARFPELEALSAALVLTGTGVGAEIRGLRPMSCADIG